jgi:putative N-acetylmannosamine-6-phosphate epimerase
MLKVLNILEKLPIDAKVLGALAIASAPQGTAIIRHGSVSPNPMNRENAMRLPIFVISRRSTDAMRFNANATINALAAVVTLGNAADTLVT